MVKQISAKELFGRIIFIRGVNVMIDRDLAKLYGVETRALKQAVRRNIERFPEDFMFELSKEEFKNWRSQFVISNSGKMGLRYAPMAFTEQGVAMLSSVLKSDHAIKINLTIIRAFVEMRKALSDHEKLRKKTEKMEAEYDQQVQMIFKAIQQLLVKEEKPKRKIGF